MVDELIFSIKKKKILNQKGQALFEMILFLPFLMFLYTIFYTSGNAINGSINQQKSVRGYFYNLVKGNSYVTPLSDLKTLATKNIRRTGFNAIGWRDHDTGETSSFAPCFKFSSLLKNGKTEECDSKERDDDRSSRYIRVFTFYGVCGPSVLTTTDQVDAKPAWEIDPRVQQITSTCSLTAN